jgi:hypothetical protein
VTQFQTDDLTHANADAAGWAARFVAGKLDGEELERFEVHLLGCEACRTEVELGMSLRAAGFAPRAVARRWAWRVAGLAAAAVVLFVLFPRGGADVARFAPLGALETPPVYLGIPVRADERDARFDAAMQSYRAGDFSRAADSLGALAAAVDAPPVHFFLGASALMIGADSLALAAFDALLALGESPYHDEGRYYRAKAWLRAGEAARALDDLRAIGDPALRAQADALADSIGVIGLR